MPYSPNQQFETPTEGQADWDTALSGNIQIAERGYHVYGTAGAACNSGQVCLVNSAGYIVPYDARSLSTRPQLMSYKSVASGESGQFISDGGVTSMAIWSGHLKIGAPVFVSPASLGFCVSSYAGAGHPVGYATAVNAIRFNPGQPLYPELTTETFSVGPVLVGSQGDFALSLANRGFAQRLEVRAQSANLYKVQFWSGSARVNSELLYETLTRSTSLGSGDINSVYMIDQAMFPWFNTDTASPALVFGRISVQSGCQVNSSNFSVSLQVERFR